MGIITSKCRRTDTEFRILPERFWYACKVFAAFSRFSSRSSGLAFSARSVGGLEFERKSHGMWDSGALPFSSSSFL
jgi:hypothetical protein